MFACMYRGIPEKGSGDVVSSFCYTIYNNIYLSLCKHVCYHICAHIRIMPKMGSILNEYIEYYMGMHRSPNAFL